MRRRARLADSNDMNETTVIDPPLNQETAILSDELLARFRDRAAAHDASGAYPHDDLAELRNSGWLLAPVPVEFGASASTSPK